jgi:TRAP-type C4-dicarboxylate transport system permease small subunit
MQGAAVEHEETGAQSVSMLADDEIERSTGVTGAAGQIVSAIQYVTGAAILVLMLLTTADVAKRSFGGGSIRGVIEITEIALVVTVFFGLVGAEVSGAHIRTSVLVDRLRVRVAGVVTMGSLSVCIFVTGWLTFQTALRAQASVQAGEYRFGLLSVPIWPARVAIALGLGALTVALIARLFGELRAWRDNRAVVVEEQTLL